MGGAQRLVPVHVANQYCRKDLSFDQKHTFNANDPKESLKGHRTVDLAHEMGEWFPLDQNLERRIGGNSCILKGRGELKGGWLLKGFGAAKAFAKHGMDPELPTKIAQDLAAMKALREVRQLDLKNLMEKLDEALNKAAQPR